MTDSIPETTVGYNFKDTDELKNWPRKAEINTHFRDASGASVNVIIGGIGYFTYIQLDSSVERSFPSSDKPRDSVRTSHEIVPTILRSFGIKWTTIDLIARVKLLIGVTPVTSAAISNRTQLIRFRSQLAAAKVFCMQPKKRTCYHPL